MDNETEKTEKPSMMVDILVSLWIVFIAVMYYGGYFDALQAMASTGVPVGPIGLFMSQAWRIYEAVLLLAVVSVGLRYFGRRPVGSDKAGQASAPTRPPGTARKRRT